jgi:hypothetical protein
MVMYKTVNFNIFEENLEDIVYGTDPALQADDKFPANKTVEIISKQSREIIIKPLNDGRLGRENPSPENSKNWR